MLSSTGAVTVTVALPETLPRVAVMTELPTPAAVTMPAALTVATVVVAELQVTLEVRFCFELSE